MWARRTILVCVLLLAAGGAYAQTDQVIDQMQPRTDASAGALAIGGGSASQQKLAQTLTVALDGEMTALFLPVACASGRLVIEVRDVVGGLPGPNLLARRTVAAARLPAVGLRFRRIALGRGLTVAAGDLRAVVLSNPTGSCGIAQAPVGDSYAGGGGFFDARPNPPGWIPLSPDLDLAFMEIVLR
jgi:hypothetical protein